MAVYPGNTASIIDPENARIDQTRARYAGGEVFAGDILDKWKLVYTKRAQKDAKKLASSGLEAQARELLRILEHDPFQSPPPFEKLRGDLAGAYSRRINLQHRLVYQVLEDRMIVKIIRMWTHYE